MWAYTHPEDLAAWGSGWRTIMCEEYDLARCGICGEIGEGNWGLQPVVDPDGWRHIACPDCRAEDPELVVAPDGELFAEYPAVDEGELPFHLDEWLRGDG